MTYDEWKIEHATKKANIIRKNNLTEVDDIVEYFDFNNMVKNELDFCPLYKDNIKCHDIEKLNCYYCGCPYFKVNDNPKTLGKTTIASTCIIDSKYKDLFYENPDENNVIKIHCDCSNCYIPHKVTFTKKYLLDCITDGTVLTDHNSLIEYVRKKQLNYIH
ncbi:MAG: hypothetical protein AB7G52_08890 [Arcobacter sp.]